MKTTTIIFLFGFLTSGMSQAALTLKESFESALHTNQIDNINEALINQNVEIKKQNEGNFLPKFALKGSYLNQEKIKTDQQSSELNLTQNLYRGSRDEYALDSASKSIAIAKNQKIYDQLALYSNVIQAYYYYFSNLNDLQNLELLKKQSKDRVDETKKRVQVGRSRKGELLQAEAQLASAEAQWINGIGLVKESEEHFYLLTGLNKSTSPMAEVIAVPTDSKSLELYLDQAYKRSDVQNKELKIQLADFDLLGNKALNFPTLDLSSNYYFNKRIGTYHNTDWDVGVSMTIPLFEGGITSAKIAESSQKKIQATHTLVDYKKSVELEVASHFETYHRYFDQIKAFDLALDKAQKSYDETLKDYRLGLVSSLDVLSSLNIYLDTKRNNEKTKISAMMSLKLLESTAGVLP